MISQVIQNWSLDNDANKEKANNLMKESGDEAQYKVKMKAWLQKVCANAKMSSRAACIPKLMPDVDELTRIYIEKFVTFNHL